MKKVIAILLGVGAYWAVGLFTYDLDNSLRILIGFATMFCVAYFTAVLLEKYGSEG